MSYGQKSLMCTLSQVQVGACVITEEIPQKSCKYEWDRLKDNLNVMSPVVPIAGDEA